MLSEPTALKVPLRFHCGLKLGYADSFPPAGSAPWAGMLAGAATVVASGPETDVGAEQAPRAIAMPIHKLATKRVMSGIGSESNFPRPVDFARGARRHAALEHA